MLDNVESPGAKLAETGLKKPLSIGFRGAALVLSLQARSAAQ
jgi:hypothetical protein